MTFTSSYLHVPLCLVWCLPVGVWLTVGNSFIHVYKCIDLVNDTVFVIDSVNDTVFCAYSLDTVFCAYSLDTVFCAYSLGTDFCAYFSETVFCAYSLVFMHIH